jgi:hypothetical protein
MLAPQYNVTSTLPVIYLAKSSNEMQPAALVHLTVTAKLAESAVHE